MNDLTVKGIKEVEGMRFHHIEGGFGKDRRAMLVKEIAKIHGRELREINERINLNRKRFKDRIDIIDLLGIGLTDTEIMQFGFTQQAINSCRGLKYKGKTSGIYVLSSRGYSKLLKILEDDLAWDRYDKLVDGYFEMRKFVNESTSIGSEAKKKEIEARYNNSIARKARELRRIAEDTTIPKEYRQILNSKITEILTGERLLPLPEVETETTLTASEIGQRLGISANKVGRLAKQHNLKNEKFGKWFYDKSPYSNKEVESFRYYEKVIPELQKLMQGGSVAI